MSWALVANVALSAWAAVVVRAAWTALAPEELGAAAGVGATGPEARASLFVDRLANGWKGVAWVAAAAVAVRAVLEGGRQTC